MINEVDINQRKRIGDLKRSLAHLAGNEGMEMSEDPSCYRRDLVNNMIRGHSTKQIMEIKELEALFNFLKGQISIKDYDRYEKGEAFTNPQDISRFKLLKEILVDLNKLKYGEKKVNVNVGYKDVQDMMFGENNAANPPNNGT